jgi:hypothetical protein
MFLALAGPALRLRVPCEPQIIMAIPAKFSKARASALGSLSGSEIKPGHSDESALLKRWSIGGRGGRWQA